MKVSIIIRTLNESRYLGELLSAISAQDRPSYDIETVIVDSGSTDQTLDIAKKFNCGIGHISRSDFSFGRSLNQGCQLAKGDILVLVSGHCIPTNNQWLKNLCDPIKTGLISYNYGKQLGGETSHYSETQIFKKYFSDTSKLPQKGFFCNNANSAILRTDWEKYRFDEEVTGLEDMELAQRLHQDGGKIGYSANAEVYHLHDESWQQIQRRFEREAIALQKIMPQIHLQIRDTIRYILSSIKHDWTNAIRERVFMKTALDIARYRYNQYVGSYKGNQEHRLLSHVEKEKYFYPDQTKLKEQDNEREQTSHRRTAANEG